MHCSFGSPALIYGEMTIHSQLYRTDTFQAVYKPTPVNLSEVMSCNIWCNNCFSADCEAQQYNLDLAFKN